MPISQAVSGKKSSEMGKYGTVRRVLQHDELPDSACELRMTAE